MYQNLPEKVNYINLKYLPKIRKLGELESKYLLQQIQKRCDINFYYYILVFEKWGSILWENEKHKNIHSIIVEISATVNLKYQQ